MLDKNQILPLHPARNPKVEWFREGDIIVLKYRKEFGRFERWLHKRLGGPEYIRRPLDEKGTLIWEMCDGNNSVDDICQALDEKFHEDIEPVVPRVWKFIEILMERNLVFILEVLEKYQKEQPEGTERE